MKKAKLWIGAAAFMSVIATDLFAADLNVNVRGRVKDYESKELQISYFFVYSQYTAIKQTIITYFL